MKSRHLHTWGVLCGWLLTGAAAFAEAPQVYALTGLRIVTAPGQSVESGAIVIRDGVIEAVGSDVTIPPDARVREVPELRAYPGLIDAYVETAWPAPEDGEPRDGAHSNALIRPERAIASHGLPAAHAKKLREAGFTTAAVASQEGLLRGRSAVLNLGEGGVRRNLLNPALAQNVTFARNSRAAGYPSSLMGSIALLRQTLLDAGWHAEAWKAYDAEPAQKRPPRNEALASLERLVSGDELVVFESASAQDALRFAALRSEFELDGWIVGSGDEYRWLDEITSIGVPLIVPADFPEVPSVPDSEENDTLATTLNELRHWEAAPGNPGALMDAGNTVALTSHGIDDPRNLLKNLHLAIADGALDPDRALAALTTTPARLLGLEDRAGTIEVGKMANFVLTEGDLFADKPSIREVWVDGHRFEVKDSKPAEIEPAGTWEILVTTGDGQVLPAVLKLEGAATALSGTISDPSNQQIPLSEVSVSGKRLEVTFDGTAYGMPGNIEFSLEIEGDTGKGSGSSPAGPFKIEGTRVPKATEDGR